MRTADASVLDTRPLAVGDHVGHRDRREWRACAPGTVTSIDTGATPPTYRIRPTQEHHWPAWEAPAADLTRLGRAGVGLTYELGAGARSTRPVDVYAPDGTPHSITIRSAMVIDVYDDAHRCTRCRVLTGDGDIWDVTGADLVYVAPWE